MPKRRTKHNGWTKMRTRMYQNLRMPQFKPPVELAAGPAQPWQEQALASFSERDVERIAMAEAKRANRCARRLTRGF